MIKFVGSKIGLITDIHLGNYRDDALWHQIALDVGKWAAQEFKQRGIEDILITGDVFHNRFEVSVTTMTTAKAFFDLLKDFNIVITIGNHDAYYRDRSDVNSLALFEEWDNITVIKETTIINQFGSCIALVPWAATLDTIDKVDTIFGHFDIAGFRLAHNKICTTGIESSQFLSKSPLTISGHFHIAAEHEYDQGKIVYLGTPYQLNWGEAGDDKFIYVYDMHASEIIEKIQNNSSPQHYRISMQHWLDNDQQFTNNEQITGHLINALIDVEQTSKKQLALSEKFMEALSALRPLRTRTTVSNDEAINIAVEFKGDGVDIRSSLTEFVGLLEVDDKLRQEALEYTLDLYQQMA